MRKYDAIWVMAVCFSLTVSAVMAVDGVNKKLLMDGVAARVNGDIVTVGDVFAVLAPTQQELMHQYTGAELKKNLVAAYKEALESVIDRRLIVQSYTSQEMKLPEWVVDERINDIIRDSFDGDRAELMAVLARDHMTFDEWRDEWKERIIEGSMRSSFVGQNISIAPGAVRERYDRDSSKYNDPERAGIRMIVLKKKAGESDPMVRRKLAEELIARLTAGESFAELAKKYSDGDRAEDGGDWGLVEPKMLRKELAEAVAELQIGTFGKIVEVESEVYVIQVYDKQKAKGRSFEDVHTQIEEELRVESAEKLYKAWVKRLRQEAYIETSDMDLF